ncbi:MAG TPA: hypothetical protein VN665_01290 [Candidatus Paceibacterota bacterium]|nr:hypothetical protein [Candidatus Paceibacterota bacterium]
MSCTPGSVITTVTIIVTGNAVAEPSATIDQSSLTTTTSTATITGTAVSATSVRVALGPEAGIVVPVVNGRWTATFSGLSAGAGYSVTVMNSTGTRGLATGTLTVQ